MTTIVYRKGVLATDAMVSDSGVNCGTTTKVFDLGGGDYVALAGNPGWFEATIAWLKKPDGAVPPPIAEGDVSGIVVHSDGTVYIMDVGPPFPLHAPWYAVGSGRFIAMGALAMGATAEQAVDIAARYDQATGGPTQTVTVA